MDTIMFWQSFILELRTLCGDVFTSYNLKKAFPINFSGGFFVFNLAEEENRRISVVTESFSAAFILFMFEDRIRKAHQADDQAGFEYLIRQRIPLAEMAESKRDVSYILLLAQSQLFSSNISFLEFITLYNLYF